jgi:hypothetical protein
MHSQRSHRKGYVLAVLLGAIGGGVAVTIATRAIPKIMSGMMQNMMAGFGEAQGDERDQ